MRLSLSLSLSLCVSLSLVTGIQIKAMCCDQSSKVFEVSGNLHSFSVQTCSWRYRKENELLSSVNEFKMNTFAALEGMNLHLSLMIFYNFLLLQLLQLSSNLRLSP